MGMSDDRQVRHEGGRGRGRGHSRRWTMSVRRGHTRAIPLSSLYSYLPAGYGSTAGGPVDWRRYKSDRLLAPRVPAAAKK